MNLLEKLSLSQARILKNTKGVHPQYKLRLKLVAEAYGENTIIKDFEEWAEENLDRRYEYPIAEYLKVVDARLGVASAESSEEKDPRVLKISEECFRLTNRLPKYKHVIPLLSKYSEDDIIKALQVYVGGLDERELAWVDKNFFADGGGEAVIMSCKNPKKLEVNLSEIESQVAEQVQKDKQAADDFINKTLEEQKQAETLTADDLF